MSNLITNIQVGNQTYTINGSATKLQIANVYSSTYKPTTMDIDGDRYNTCEKLYADILINFNTDINTLWKQKDMFITIAKYSKNKRKFVSETIIF